MTTALPSYSNGPSTVALLGEWTDEAHAVLADLGYEGERDALTTPVKHPAGRRLTSTAVWRTRAVQQLHDAVVRAAPVGPREWVLTAGGLPTLYGARAVRRH